MLERALKMQMKMLMEIRGRNRSKRRFTIYSTLYSEDRCKMIIIVNCHRNELDNQKLLAKVRKMSSQSEAAFRVSCRQ